MADRPDFLRRSMIIGAHPDDELLWFNAILADVDEVVVVFREFWAQPGLGAARARALAEYPRGSVTSLDLDESGAYGCANWQNPVETGSGIALTFEAQKRELKRMSKLAMPKVGPVTRLRVADASVVAMYEANFRRLCDALRPRLRPDMNVFSHNPWGEYGHEEHIQVFRALQLLRRELGFKLWMSNYCTDRSMPMAMRYFRTAPGPYIRLPTNKAFADTVADVYKRHGCWTWADDWAWFDEECYMEAPEEGAEPAPHRHLFPLNFFAIDAERQRNWMPLAVGLSAAAASLSLAIDL